MATKTPAKKLSTLSNLISEAANLRAQMEEIKLTLKPLAAKFDEVEEQILASLLDSGTEQHKVETATCSVRRTSVPKVTDWGKLNKYVVKNDATDLYQARLHAAAYNERVAAGEKIPGVETVDVTGLAWRWAK